MPGKLDTASVLERVFAAYGRQARLFLPVALLVFLPVAVVQGLARHDRGGGLTLLATVLGLVTTYLYQGVVVEAVRDIQDGRRDLGIGGALRSVRGVLARVIAAALLAGIGTLLGLALLVVPGLVLSTVWALIVPVIVIERTSAIDALGRSRELVVGNGWRVFGVIVVLLVVEVVLSLVLGTILSGGARSVAGSAIGNLAVQAIVSPFQAIAVTIMYLDLRRLHGEPPVPAS